MTESYVFTNVLGTHVLDGSFKIIRTLKQGDSCELPSVPEDKLPEVLLQFKSRAKDFFQEDLRITKQSIKDSISKDNLIIQSIKVIDDLDKVANTMAKRLRDWYSLYNPEFSHSISNHQKFVQLILERDKEQLLSELKVNLSMGADLEKSDVDEILALASEVKSLYEMKDRYANYIGTLMKEICPNMLVITGPLIGAKLIEEAGSLKQLVILPASTVQLLGAEKALFRHMKTGAKPPKFGLLFNHPLINHAKRDVRGKVARALADKISLALKIDYFKGEYIGDKLKADLDKRFGK